MAETGETAQTQLIYGRDDRPSFGPSLLAAFAHLFAIVASILTAPLLIARAIGLDVDSTQYVISASLVVSGIATFIQTYRIGPIGSGLLAVQGTSLPLSAPWRTPPPSYHRKHRKMNYWVFCSAPLRWVAAWSSR